MSSPKLGDHIADTGEFDSEKETNIPPASTTVQPLQHSAAWTYAYVGKLFAAKASRLAPPMALPNTDVVGGVTC